MSSTGRATKPVELGVGLGVAASDVTWAPALPVAPVAPTAPVAPVAPVTLVLAEVGMPG